jgi:hypothetical protein
MEGPYGASCSSLRMLNMSASAGVGDTCNPCGISWFWWRGVVVVGGARQLTQSETLQSKHHVSSCRWNALPISLCLCGTVTPQCCSTQSLFITNFMLAVCSYPRIN